MLKPVIACLIAQSLAFMGGGQSATDEFRSNDLRLKGASFDSGPSHFADRNLDLILHAVHREGRVDGKFLKAWNGLAAGNDDGLSTQFSWVDADLIRLPGGIIVASATYGPISRIAAWDAAGTVLAIPNEFRHFVRWNPKLVWANGTLLLISSSIQDAGMRVASRVDVLPRTAQGFSRGASLEIQHTLDWGGASVHGSTLTINGLDDPKSFIVASADDKIFRRREAYTIRNGTISRIASNPLDQPLRALDEYIYGAQHAKTPDPFQRIARKVMPEPNMLEVHMVREKGDRAEIVIEAEGPKGVFQLRRIKGHWVVESAK